MKQRLITCISTIVIIAMIYMSATAKTEVAVSADTQEEVVETETVATVFVEIKGAINMPGIYEVDEGTRLFEVIELAGGLSADANIDYINQTRVLVDQSLIMILTNQEIEQKISEEMIAEYEASIVEVATSQSTVIGGDNCLENFGADSTLISINHATVEELMTLPGIGEAKAIDIIAYRDNNNGYKTLEELMDVNGIGEATFNKIKALISL